MKKLSIVCLCLVLLMVFTGVATACTPSHTCQSVCPTCSKCSNADCVEDVCQQKCECPPPACQDYCYYCKGCKGNCDATALHTACQCQPLTVQHTTWDILVGKPTQTAVHQFVTNKPGPAVVIVGGTHGDETAGWNAALQLVDPTSPNYIGNMPGVCGQILVIPQANKLSNLEVKRTATGYSDLNRSFPTERYSSAKDNTIEISNAIVQTIAEFNLDYNVQYFVDLHEAKASWQKALTSSSGSVGDTLIFTNCQVFMRKMIKHYNKTYRLQDEPNFLYNEATQKGSYSYHYTHTYPDRVVFTIETNREHINGVDTIPLEKRVRQQINMLNAMFDYAWERI